MNKEKLLAFNGDTKIKEKYIARVKAHQEADEIIKGTYWENGKGCAVGCTIHGNKHDDYETELGISWRIALLEDSLFEKLPNELAKKFPLEFLESIPVGCDTDLVFKKFIIWNLSDKKEGLIYHIKDKEVIKLLKEISDTYKKSLTKEITQKVWKQLVDKSVSAYTSASASASVYASASAFAYASTYAYAYASAEWQQKFDERILRMKEKLLELFKESN